MWRENVSHLTALTALAPSVFYSAFFIYTGDVATALGVKFEQQSWIITAYSVTFAAFLLFWGRVSDLYSAKPVFCYGFLVLGVLSLILSFLTDKYSFFVLRALAGIAGSCLVPSAYRLITEVFAPEEHVFAFTLYGLSASTANMAGMVMAGLIRFIGNDRGVQMQSWRWFFRIMAVLIFPIVFVSFKIVPKREGVESKISEAKWRRLDLVGAMLFLSSIVMLILGLTLGASYGWKTAKFLVPFLLSFVLLPLFFVWEGSLKDSHALLPNKTWRIPNFAVFIILTLELYAWWAITLLSFTEIWMNLYGELAIIAAIRHAPQGVMAFSAPIALNMFPAVLAKPRIPIIIGMSLAVAAYALYAHPIRIDHRDYWHWIFPAMIIGSGGNMTVFTAANVGVMVSVPPHMAGVVGAMFQVALQTGVAIALSVQAGLLTINPGGLAKHDNVKASYYFQMGWAALWLIMFVVFYRTPPPRPLEPSPSAISSGGSATPKGKASMDGNRRHYNAPVASGSRPSGSGTRSDY